MKRAGPKRLDRRMAIRAGVRESTGIRVFPRAAVETVDCW
jgi:hypothetical protein